MNDCCKMLLVLLIDGYENLKADKFTNDIRQLTVDCLRILFNNVLTEEEFTEIVKRMDDVNFPAVRFPSGFAELMDE